MIAANGKLYLEITRQLLCWDFFSPSVRCSRSKFFCISSLLPISHLCSSENDDSCMIEVWIFAPIVTPCSERMLCQAIGTKRREKKLHRRVRIKGCIMPFSDQYFALTTWTKSNDHMDLLGNEQNEIHHTRRTVEETFRHTTGHPKENSAYTLQSECSVSARWAPVEERGMADGAQVSPTNRVISEEYVLFEE